MVEKAGCILVNNNKIALVYRKKHNDYSFPKGHLEQGETLKECAMRETEEETGRLTKINDSVKLPILQYLDSNKEETNVHFYFANDIGKSDVTFDENLVHDLLWVDVNDVSKKISYGNLKNYWNSIKNDIL